MLALRCFGPGGVAVSNLHLDPIGSSIITAGPVVDHNTIVLGHSRNTGCSLGHPHTIATGNSEATRWSFCCYEWAVPCAWPLDFVVCSAPLYLCVAHSD